MGITGLLSWMNVLLPLQPVLHALLLLLQLLLLARLLLLLFVFLLLPMLLRPILLLLLLLLPPPLRLQLQLQLLLLASLAQFLDQAATHFALLSALCTWERSLQSNL